jgi:lipopolysaccharide export system permease protein
VVLTSINSEAGTWRKVGNDYIHINAIAPGGEELIGVSRYTVNDQRELVSASFCRGGRVCENLRLGATGACSMSVRV